MPNYLKKVIMKR